MEKTNRLLYDLIAWKGDKLLEKKKHIDGAKRYIKGLKERQAVIHVEVMEIMNAEFWAIWEIPKPDFKLMFDENYHALVEDLEQDIETFEKQPEPANNPHAHARGHRLIHPEVDE
jgi:hypothetical protein